MTKFVVGIFLLIIVLYDAWVITNSDLDIIKTVGLILGVGSGGAFAGWMILTGAFDMLIDYSVLWG